MKYEAFNDLPWLKEDIIELVDKTFLNSKFIYLERDEEEWKKSLSNWTLKKTGNLPDIESALSDFQAHKKFVLNYFKNRPEDLLILNVKEENGFEILASFLGKKAPNKKLPYSNRTS